MWMSFMAELTARGGLSGDDEQGIQA